MARGYPGQSLREIRWRKYRYKPVQVLKVPRIVLRCMVPIRMKIT